MANVCERLLQLQPDLTTKPGLAEKYEWTDTTTLVFTVRQGVTFHDGSTMTADDVLWSLQRHAADGATESDEFVNVTAIAKTGPNEVTVTFKQPDAVFLQAIAGDAGVVSSRRRSRRRVRSSVRRRQGRLHRSVRAGGVEVRQQIVLTRPDVLEHREGVEDRPRSPSLGQRRRDRQLAHHRRGHGSYLETLSSATQLAGGPSPPSARAPTPGSGT